MIELSVVATLYRSADYLDEFYRRMVSCCEQLTESFEIILVNDGSPDDSLKRALAIHHKDPRIKVIDLSRNFGHHKAMMTGLSHAKGEQVFLIDSDLEEPPELLLQFKKMLDEDIDIDMVYGQQHKRKGGWFERFSGKLFYKVVNALVDQPIASNFLTVRLMTRRYVRQLCLYQERELTFATLVSLTGFNSKGVYVDKSHKGVSSYTLSKKFSILINIVTSSSAKPLYFIFILGLLITMISVICIGYIFTRKLFFGIAIQGWASLIVSIWFIGGVLMLSVGVMGIYMSKIFMEVKHRPYVNTKAIYEKKKEP